jgi:hypothetical protein
MRPRPSDEVLAERLADTLDSGGPVVLLDRQPSGSGTLPKEVVRCRLRDGTEQALFCKYAAPRLDAHGHRGGIRYEAEVYRRVLATSASPTPGFAGAVLDDEDGEDSLFLEFLEGGERLSERYQELATAARWLGRFHLEFESPSERADLSFLIRYDEDYYLGWARRTAEYAGHWKRCPWLSRLCDRFTEVVAVLLEAPQTVIHGEYTIHNVMLVGAKVHPTDWESAAIGAGEIDVMCLVDRWPEETVELCVREYATARWGEDVPTGYAERLAAAELYLHFRWLGEHPDLMLHEKRRWRLARLELLAERLGVLA